MLNWIELDKEALINNYKIFKNIAAPHCLVPVLKSNAYGHGLREVYEVLEPLKPDWLSVNYLYEAKELRELGYRERILVVGPATIGALKESEELGLDLVVGQIEVLQEVIHNYPALNIHIKFDTGMGRQGFLLTEVDQIIAKILKQKEHIEQVKGICTHFANVEDVTEQDYADLQMQNFEKVTAQFRAAGIKVYEHSASSASCLLMDKTRQSLSRVGISLYGFWPSQATKISYLQMNKNLIALKPVLGWYTQITNLKTVAAGQYIGYGCTYKTNKPTKVAVLPVGYFEGYPRVAGDHNSYVLIQGQRCPLIGRICMNMMMVDVTHLTEVKVGAKVTLIGKDQSEEIAASDLASWAQTIHYELVTRLNNQIDRRIMAGLK